MAGRRRRRWTEVGPCSGPEQSPDAWLPDHSGSSQCSGGGWGMSAPHSTHADGKASAAGPVPTQSRVGAGLAALPAESQPLQAALRREWEQLSLNGDEASPAARGPAPALSPPPTPAPGRRCSSQAIPVASVPSPEVTPTASSRLACWTIDWQISSNAPPHFTGGALGPEGAQGAGLASDMDTPQAPPSGERSELSQGA